MGESSELNYHAGTFAPMAVPPCAMTRGNWQPPQKKIPLRDSVFAFAFLIFYLTAYLAAGFAGIAAVKWAWAVLFR
jgi:hypothetical protein